MIEENEQESLSAGGSPYEYTRTLLFCRRFLAAVCPNVATRLTDLRTATPCTPDPAASQRDHDHPDPVPPVPLSKFQSLLPRVRPASPAQRISSIGELLAFCRIDADRSGPIGGLSAHAYGPMHGDQLYRLHCAGRLPQRPHPLPSRL